MSGPVQCPECGKEVCEDAVACPDCGCALRLTTLMDKLEQRLRRRRWVSRDLLIAAIILAPLGLIHWWLSFPAVVVCILLIYAKARDMSSWAQLNSIRRQVNRRNI